MTSTEFTQFFTRGYPLGRPLVNLECLPGDHVDGKQAIRHDQKVLSKLAVHLCLRLTHLPSAFSFDPLRRTHALDGARVSRVI